MDNILSNIGDSLLISTAAKMTGKARITAFTEVISGVTTDRTLYKEFRISQDGIFWSEWQEMNVTNLSATEYIVDAELNIDVRYTRTGTDTTGTITFSKINFTGTRQAVPFEAPTLFSSIFSKFVGTTSLKNIETNLFKKLYFRGILPKYIERGDNRDYNEDKDFVSLFFPIARFYGLLLSFFQRWENIPNDADMLREQLRGYGIYFDESNITLSELQYLAQNILSQAQQRGTKMIFSRKGTTLPSGSTAQIDGEFLRLTRNKASDELLYETLPLWKSGWCMGQSSPLYKGTAQAYNLNKTKENTEDFESLDDFTINSTAPSSLAFAEIATSGDKKVLRINATTTTSGRIMIGLGRVLTTDTIPDNLYVADTQLDYEITFAFRWSNTLDKRAALLFFGVEGFDVNKNYLNDAFCTTEGNVNSGFFQTNFVKYQNDIWYYARGIIHAYSSENYEGATNLGIGENLRFNNSFVKYILPQIQIRTLNGPTAQFSVDIWNYKIRPLIRGKNIIPLSNGEQEAMSLGFIQSSKLTHTYYRNNNNSQSQDEVTSIIQKYLYPFNTTDIFTIMSNK